MNTKFKTPSELRKMFRSGADPVPTSGLAPGTVQANLVILPKALAFDFLLFCQRNPKPCPLIEVLDPGSYEVRTAAPGSDIRKDIPLYRIYKHGNLSEVTKSIDHIWQDDFVSFLLGCSFSFENALVQDGIKLPHFENGTNVSMYTTNIQTEAAGAFSGPMVVSMRYIPRDKIVRAVQITSRFPSVHGSPIHIGNPSEIGILDLNEPDFGDKTPIQNDDVPVFWACGVTPQSIAMHSQPSLMITHAPGHMFITDKQDSEYSIL